MIDIYCNSTGIGDSLLYTQVVHELAKQDKVRLSARYFAWHGKRYHNNEENFVNPIWFNNPDVSEFVLTEIIPHQFHPFVSGRQHHSLDICNKYNIMNIDEPKLYLYPERKILPPTNTKNVGVFLRKTDVDDNYWNYSGFEVICELLCDSGINVYQIDGEERLILNAHHEFKELGVKDLCSLVGNFDCVLGQTTGATHIAKAFGVKTFDIWDFKRFGLHTMQVYQSYSYKENTNIFVNGDSVSTPESIAASILRYLS